MTRGSGDTGMQREKSSQKKRVVGNLLHGWKGFIRIELCKSVASVNEGPKILFSSKTLPRVAVSPGLSVPASPRRRVAAAFVAAKGVAVFICVR